MANVTVEIDMRQLLTLGQDFERGSKAALIRLAERGKQLIRQEAPEDTGRLKGKRSNGGSVTSEIRQVGGGWQAELNVSAVRERTNAQSAEVVSVATGKRKTITLRPQKAFNYAKVVATGRPRLTVPKQARAFLVPVSSAPSSGSYIVANGRIFVARKTIAEQPANDYPGRAAVQLQSEAPDIVGRTVEAVLNQKGSSA